MQIMRTARTLFAAAVLTAAALIAAPTPQAHAAVFVSVGFAPPAIPVYAQPVMPGDGYVWTPGYWAYGPDGYYWVDGAWILPPYVGALWTPGWWGWGGGLYYWHPGYWGRTVGYYGGINYGFGYFGTGFVGGYWNGGHFFYNTAYAHIPVGFHGAVYSRSYAGFSGHPGGASFVAHPPAQFAAASHGAEAFHGSAVNGREDFHAQQGLANRGAENNMSRSPQNLDNRGSQSFENRSAQPSYNRAPAAPSANYNRGGSAPAPHNSAPSGGGNRGGGEHGHR